MNSIIFRRTRSAVGRSPRLIMAVAAVVVATLAGCGRDGASPSVGGADNRPSTSTEPASPTTTGDAPGTGITGGRVGSQDAGSASSGSGLEGNSSTSKEPGTGNRTGSSDAGSPAAGSASAPASSDAPASDSGSANQIGSSQRPNPGGLPVEPSMMPGTAASR